MATNEIEFLGRDGTEQLVATVKNLLTNNQTHWIEPNGVLLEESNAASFTHPTFGTMWLVNHAPNLEVGKTYAVIYNGATYECVCQVAPAGLISDPYAVAMGNFSVVGGANTGEPFAMLISTVFQEVDIIDLSGAASVKVKILGEVYHKLDQRFLPHEIITVNIEVPLTKDFDNLNSWADGTADKTKDEIAAKLVKNPNATVRAKIRIISSDFSAYDVYTTSVHTQASGDLVFIADFYDSMGALYKAVIELSNICTCTLCKLTTVQDVIAALPSAEEASF